MRARTLFDLVLVVVAALLAYAEVFGWSEPAAGLQELLELFTSLDTTVYLVIAGVIGMIFVGYVAVYLPKRITQQSAPDHDG